jgi:hypothetical protein
VVKKLHLRFRDLGGLKEYSYELQDLEKVIQIMEQVCGYKYDGSE